MRFAIVTTARLHYRGDAAFEVTDETFRPIDGVVFGLHYMLPQLSAGGVIVMRFLGGDRAL